MSFGICTRTAIRDPGKSRAPQRYGIWPLDAHLAVCSQDANLELTAAMTQTIPRRIYTIGHSTRSLEEVLHILKAYGIGHLADIRSLAGSRRVPQFNQETLAPGLEASGIHYTHLKLLGGLRPTRRDSPNTGWRNRSFRGYADYMQTAEFSEGLHVLETLARQECTAIMCAEAVPWRCHRSLVADALLIRGWEVLHLFSPAHAEAHRLCPFARLEGLHITYPAAEP